MHDRYAVDRLLNSINYYVSKNENISQSLLKVKSSLSSAYSSSYTGTLNGNNNAIYSSVKANTKNNRGYCNFTVRKKEAIISALGRAAKNIKDTKLSK